MLLLDDEAPAALPAAPLSRVAREGRASGLVAVIHRWGLDAAEFDVRIHPICDSSGFPRGTVLATVANRRLRTSRTYLYDPHVTDCPREFEQDVCSGVFGPIPGAGG